MALGVAVPLGVGVTVAVAVGVGVGVGVIGGVGVGLGVMSEKAGPATSTVTGEPVLKKPMVAFEGVGGKSESNRKLYSVPQRIALAF